MTAAEPTSDLIVCDPNRMSVSDVVTLREYFDTHFVALTERLELYIQTQAAMQQRLAEQVRESAAAIDKRLEGMNALRVQIEGERGLYLTRDQADQRMSNIEQRFQATIDLTNMHYTENGKRIAELEKARANLDGKLATVAASLVVIQICLSIAAHFWK